MKNNFIIGTAGHIDHGKSTLIKALTGRETDTLKEERERGISINLGFTYLDLSNGKRAGIIDAPGHENFVKNMMAGTVGIDLILLVIAADDGVMPQTIEHAQILHYMGVDNAIIVITKTDKVDPELIELVEEDIRLSFKNTILNESPIIKVDSVSKKGLKELVDLITDKLHNLPDDEDIMATRMNIDRSFSLKGIGTVVTGTLIEGMIEIDKDYMIYPSMKMVKIRSIESHGIKEDRAYKGQRVALNLSNISKDEINRGDIIASPHSLNKVDNIQAKLSLSENSDKPLKHRDRIRLFHGTQEVLGRVVPLSKKEINPSETEFVEIRLEEDIYAKKNDRFVIRSYSPVKTIGGGVILSMDTGRHSSNDISYVEYLMNKEKYSLDEDIIDFLINFKDIEEISIYTGINYETLSDALKKLQDNNQISKIDDKYISNLSLKSYADKADILLKEYHKIHPYEEGINKEEFRQRMNLDLTGREYDEFINNKVIKTKVNSNNDYIFLRDFKVHVDKKDQEFDEVLKMIKDEEPKLLKLKEIKANKEVLNYLLKNDLVKLDEFVITSSFLEKLKEDLINFLNENNTTTVAEFRDMSNMSRKQALLVLEYFDKKNITIRDGDFRKLK